MKRFLALCLSALLVLTCMVGVLSVSAEGVEPAYLIDGIHLNPVGAIDCTGNYDFEAGYATLNVTGSDPYYTVLSTDEATPATVADYMVIKYRTTAQNVRGGAYMCYNSDIVALSGAGIDCIAEFDYMGDGEWHNAVVYLPDVVAPEAYNPETKALKYMRFDFIDIGAAAGQTLEVEYIAFFANESDADEFVHVKPEMTTDGSYKTLDFGDAEALAVMFDPNNKIDVTYEMGLGYTTFTSTGTDPYLRFWDSNDNQGDFGVVGYEAAYILVKYRTAANSQNKTEICFFTNCGATQWGADGSFVKAELVVNPAEGEGADAWHYVKVNATAAWGGSNNALYAFRMDPLSEAIAGETIDIAEIKFFAQETYMLDYLDGLAEEGDEAAIDYFDRLPCTHSTTEIIPAVAPTCTEDGLTDGVRCTDKCGVILKAQRPVPAGHDFSVEVPAKEATAEEDGYTAHLKCANCDATEGKEIVVYVPVEESSTAIDETTEAEESTEAEDTTAADDTAAAGDDTTAAGDDTTKATEDTTAPAAEGCKAVIASASILGVVALAAGAVICRKKD